MGILLLLIHISVCFMLIMVVLLQSGKAADLAGAFGGGGSQTALGSRGAATLLTKATTTCAVLFMLTSLGLALLGSSRGGSVLDDMPDEVAMPAQDAVGTAFESQGVELVTGDEAASEEIPAEDTALASDDEAAVTLPDADDAELPSEPD